MRHISHPFSSLSRLTRRLFLLIQLFSLRFDLKYFENASDGMRQTNVMHATRLKSKMNRLHLIVFVHLAALSLIRNTSACRVNSELVKSYTKESIERLLDLHQFESLYWPDEPLSSSLLAKATGINITLAETHFDLSFLQSSNEIESGNNGKRHQEKRSLIQDIFVACSVSRDRSYALSINLELENPFKSVDLLFDIPSSLQSDGLRANEVKFRIRLPQSSFLVQLSQRIKYDECLTINYVQLEPSVNYEIECTSCDERQRAHLNTAFNKRMSQFGVQLDSLISEKLLFGLQVLINQQRLDLD